MSSKEVNAETEDQEKTVKQLIMSSLEILNSKGC